MSAYNILLFPSTRVFPWWSLFFLSAFLPAFIFSRRFNNPVGSDSKVKVDFIFFSRSAHNQSPYTNKKPGGEKKRRKSTRNYWWWWSCWIKSCWTHQVSGCYLVRLNKHVVQIIWVIFFCMNIKKIGTHTHALVSFRTPPGLPHEQMPGLALLVMPNLLKLHATWLAKQ